MKTFIGIDFGGTKMLIGELDADGEILRSHRYDTGFTNQKQAVDALLECLDDYIKNIGFVGTPIAAGIGIVGVVDHTNGVWVAMNHLEKNPINLANIVSEKLKIPAAIDNDVRSAATAELLLGYGRETGNFIYLNVGTGIAAGFVVNGNILRGANDNSGEVGHTVVNYKSNIACMCGRYGCVESIASGSGFTKRVRTLAPAMNTRLTMPEQGKGVDIAQIFQLSDQGDQLCKLLTEDAVEALSCTIMNLVRVTDPDTFIVGGGVVSDGWLLPKILDKLNPATMRGVKNGVVVSKFQPEFAGLIGAGALAMVKAKEKK